MGNNVFYIKVSNVYNILQKKKWKYGKTIWKFISAFALTVCSKLIQHVDSYLKKLHKNAYRYVCQTFWYVYFVCMNEYVFYKHGFGISSQKYSNLQFY